MTWPPARFGDAWAVVYDDAHPHLRAETPAAIAWMLGRVPAGGRVLDLGVGTGRLAIPLAAAGLSVVGVDASAQMLQVMARKTGGHRVQPVIGDIAAPPVGGPFDMVLLAFNTLFALPDADAQIRCLRAAAGVLAAAGEVVVDAAIPQPWRLDPATHDQVRQVVRAVQVVEGAGALPLDLRYADPDEVDAMAAAAGLRRVVRLARWGGAAGEDCVDRHISAYRAAGPADGRPGDLEAGEQAWSAHSTARSTS